MKSKDLWSSSSIGKRYVTFRGNFQYVWDPVVVKNVYNMPFSRKKFKIRNSKLKYCFEFNTTCKCTYYHQSVYFILTVILGSKLKEGFISYSLSFLLPSIFIYPGYSHWILTSSTYALQIFPENVGLTKLSYPYKMSIYFKLWQCQF